MYKGLNEIMDATERATKLTHQLLAFSRNQKMETCIINLNKLITNLNKMMSRLVSEEIEFQDELTEGLFNISADPNQIEQVLINLVVNAKDAMPNGGKLTIQTNNLELHHDLVDSGVHLASGSYAEIRVQDTGFGIPAKIQEKIFEPFFTTKKKGKGTGLGLSTVYGIVKQSGGELLVRSKVGYGTTFRLLFPAVAASADEITNDIQLELPRGSETILIAEDEEQLRAVMIVVLSKLGYNVIEAENGEMALSICQRLDFSIDLVITDLIMPKMGGQELAVHLLEIWCNLKIIFMSGYTSEDVPEDIQTDENAQFMQKPFRPVDLAWQVRRVLDS
jgi:CheY-like chemotaxis protein